MKKESGSLKSGLSEQTNLGQKEPRGETANGQRPKCKTSKVSTDRGKFKMK